MAFKRRPTVAHVDLPSFRLHPLKGEMKGFWAVRVRANRRVIFLDEGAEDIVLFPEAQFFGDSGAMSSNLYCELDLWLRDRCG